MRRHRTAQGFGRSSEIPFLLFAFHGSAAVVVDEAATPFGELALRGFPDDSGERRGAAFDRTGERIAAERPEPDGSDLWLLACFKRQAMVVDHDQRAAAAPRPSISDCEARPSPRRRGSRARPVLLAAMSPADPPIVAPAGRRSYGWLRGQE